MAMKELAKNDEVKTQLMQLIAAERSRIGSPPAVLATQPQRQEQQRQEQPAGEQHATPTKTNAARPQSGPVPISPGGTRAVGRDGFHSPGHRYQLEQALSIKVTEGVKLQQRLALMAEQLKMAQTRLTEQGTTDRAALEQSGESSPAASLAQQKDIQIKVSPKTRLSVVKILCVLSVVWRGACARTSAAAAELSVRAPLSRR